MRKPKFYLLFGICFLTLITPNIVFGMHIMEGFLSPVWAGVWTILATPFVIKGFLRINEIVKNEPKKKLLLALVGAFVFVLSALKLPSITGSSSHPTGVGLGAIL